MKASFPLTVLAILLCGTPDAPDPPLHNHGVTVLPLRVCQHPHQLHLLGSLQPAHAQDLKINIIIRFYCFFQQHALTMTSIISGTDFEHLDPTTPLSTPDIIQLLLKSCDRITNENIKFEREYSKAMLDTEVNGIMKTIKMLAGHISSQNSKIADLEMKVDTKNKYHEELMCSLKKGLQTTFFNIGNDVRNITTKLKSCEICERTFDTFQQLLVHSVNEHSQHPQDNTSNFEEQCPNNKEPLILQVDGNDSDFLFSESDEESRASPGLRQLSVTGSTSSKHPLDPQQPSVSHRIANFALNKAKQVQSIGADTNLEDFSVIVNDSDKNVNIQCSTAVYETVVKPLFSNFTKGTNFKCNNISVSCSHVDYNRDKNCFEYNKVIHVILGGSGQFNIGKVTIHLHHTKRSIQMQGSALMPDGNRTPVWFLTHVLWEKLVSLAAEKQVDITRINTAVRDAVENRATVNIANICQHCTRLFDTKSKPTRCNHCLCFFHKTSCLPVHSNSCTNKQNLAPTIPTSGAPSSASLSRPSLAPSQKRRRTVADCPQTSPPPSTSSPRQLTSHPRSSFDIQQNQVITRPPPPQALSTLASPPADATHSSPPGNPPFSSQSSPTLTVAPTNPPSLNAFAVPFNPGFTNNKKKTTRANRNLNPEQAKIDFLNIELDATKTKIVQLETAIEDRDVTITILNEKIKLLEQNQQDSINNKYKGPNPHRYNTHSYPCNQALTCCSPPACRCQSHCPQSHHCQHQAQADSGSSGQVPILTEIKRSLDDIKAGIYRISVSHEKHVTTTTSDNPAVNTTVVNTEINNKVPSPTGNHDHIETVSVEIVESGNVSDDSVASADYFVPEPNLNCRIPTSQHLLMQ